MSEYKLLINGELVNSRSGKTVDDIGPATGEPIAQVPLSSMEDVERAVAAAREAFDDGRWSGLTHGTRASILEKLATTIDANPAELAAWKIGPALAAGNTVVIKPSVETPLTTLKLGEIALEAGLPPGVLNIVTSGPGIAQALSSHPKVNMVSITGSTESGKQVMRAGAETVKHVHLELGGKAPFIVYDDANIEAAVNGPVVGGYVNCGQDCTAATRIYVQDSIYDEFLQSFLNKVKQIRVGNPANESTDMGPLIS